MPSIADYNAWKAKQQQNGVGAAQTVLGAVNENPDEVAGDLNLANEFGKVTGNPVPPVPMVKEYRSVFQQAIEREKNNTILSKSPVLSEWLRNPENAAVAKDDLAGLSWWESLGKNLKEIPKGVPGGAVSAGGMALEGAGQLLTPADTAPRNSLATAISQAAQMKPEDIAALRQRIFGQGDVNPQYAQSVLSDVLSGNMQPADAIEALAPLFTPALKAASEAFQAGGEKTQEFGASILPAEKGFENSTGRQVGSGLGSLLTIIAASLATGPYGAGAVGGAMGAGEAASNARQAGADEDTQTIAALYGILPGLTDALPVERLLSNPATKAGIASFLRSVGLQSLIEGGQEAGQQIMQNAIAQNLYAPDKSMLDQVFDNFKSGGIVGAIAEAGKVAFEAMLPGRFHRMRSAAQRAPETQQKLAEISAQAQASVLRTRMPDKFRQFVEQATANGPVENVYVPADQFVQYFQGRDIDPYTLVDELDGVTRDDLDAALAGGGDLQIPTATYAAKIAGSEHDAFLMENMRFDPDEFTAREAAEFNEKAQDAMQEAFEIAESVRAEREQLSGIEDQIYDSMVSRLRTAGRSTDVATNEALLYPAFYRVMAERSGMSTEEFLGRYPLPEIKGDLPEGMQFRDVDELTRTLAEARNRRAAGLDKRKSLLEFISDYGGINDVGGELKSREAETVKRGKGKKTLKLARGGMVAGARDLFGASGGKKHGADDVALAAIEAGYLADEPEAIEFRAAMEEGREVPDITRALWSAIDRELRGDAQYAPDAEADARASEEARLDQIEEYLSSLGVSLNDDDATIRQAIEGARQYAQPGDVTQTEAFKRWFGDSKVVDENGKPLVVYHGTAAKSIDQFRPEKIGTANDQGFYGVGYYFTADRKLAEAYIPPRSKGSVQEVYLSIQNPFVWDLSTPDLEAETIARARSVMPDAQVTTTGVHFKQRQAWTEALKAAGYDGVISKSGDKFDEIVAFEPTQVKSVNNRGTFDPNDARLLFQSGGMGPRGLIQFAAGGIGKGDTVIRLFQSADLSTFLHESGHYFLTVLRDMAGQGGAAATDFETVKSWWRENAADVAKDAMRVMPDVSVTADDVIAAIDNGGTGDVLRDAAIDIGMQEQWARGFEKYLMEGKAPSVELRSAFEKFRAWLISIYQRLAGLNVKISDDLRGVFDRMLATDEEIAKAQVEAGGNHPLFANAEEMGLTPEEYAGFMKLRAQSEDEAKSRLLRETMEPIKRAQEKWFKDERAKVREEVEREVNAYRYYRAYEWMGNRRWLGSDQPEDMPDIRLSKDILVERYGKGVLETLPRGKQTVYTVEGGIDPDVAAGMFGFDSGDEMIRAMEKAPKRKEAIEAETDRVMRERHGDALNDGSIEAKALDTVHNDKRGQWLAAELNAVVDVAGTGARLTAKEARATAKQTLSRMRVRDAMNANRFLAAERKAAEESARLGAMLAREGIWMNNARRRIAGKARAAMRGEGTVDAVAPQIEQANRSTGNYNETVARLIETKRRQLLNHALYMEARKVADEVEKAENLVSKLEKSTRKIRSERKRFGEASIAGDYVEAIEAIIYGYEFRRVSNRQIDRRAALRAYVERMTADGRANELAIPQSVLDDAQVRNYRTLTVEHLRGVVDSLKNLEHTARLKGKLLIAKKQRDFEEAVSGLVNQIETNAGSKPLDWIGDDSITGKAREAVNGYISTFQSATTIIRQIDGREDLGKAYETLKTDMDSAAYDERDMRKQATEDVLKLYSVYSPDEQRQMAVRRVVPELGGRSFSKWNLIAMALNMGNEGNLARLTNSKAQMHLTAAEVEAVKNILDERDARFIQSVWSYMGSYRPKIAERDRRIRGIEPNWVDPMPVTIGGVDLTGGYYPIKYEGRLGGSHIVTGPDDEILNAMMGGGYSSAATKDGHLKARGENVKTSLTLDIGVIAQHTNEVIHDLAFSEAVVNTWRILTNNAVDQAFKKARLDEQHAMLKLWVQDAATGQISAGSKLARSVSLLRSGFTYSKLALNLKTILMQPLGLMQSGVVVGKRNLANQILRYMQNPVAMTNDVLGRSRMMWERRETFNKDLMDAASKKNIASPTASKLRSFMDDYAIPFGMAGITYSQFYIVDVPTWAAAYNKGLKQFGDEAKAAQFADMTVQRSQGSGIWSDRSGIERGTLSGSIRQNPFVTLLTTLGSYFFAKTNILIERTQGLAAEPLSAGKSVSYALDMALLFAGEAAVIALLSELGGDDDDDDEDASMISSIASQGLRTFLAGLPVVRDAVGLYDGYGGGTYSSILNMPVAVAKQAKQGEVDPAFVKSVINMTGMMMRLPSSQVNRFIDAGWRDLEGEDVSPVEYLMGRSRN